MLITSLTVLMPVLFVMGLGYWAGRAKKFDADQVEGLNGIVLDYALPALMFVGIAKTTRSQMLAQVPFLIAVLIAFVGIFLFALFFSLFVRHHSLGKAALQANLVSFPSVAFMGIPIFRGLFGNSGLLSITSATVLASLTLVPMTVVLLEIHAQHTTGNPSVAVTKLVRNGLVTSFKKPMVWAPLLATILVLSDVTVPREIDRMLTLIGSATSGLSIFLAGLIIAAYKIRLNFDVVGNVLLKMIVQPVLMTFLVSTMAVANPLGREAILICAIPTAIFAPLLAPRYHVHECESASTLVLTTVTMIVTLPVAIILTGG